jgi:hypothetical protein
MFHRNFRNEAFIIGCRRLVQLERCMSTSSKMITRAHNMYGRSRQPLVLRRVSLTGIAGSIPARGMDVCLLWVLCVVRYRALRRVDQSSRGVLPSVVCLSVISKPQQWGGLSPLGLSSLQVYIYIYIQPFSPKWLNVWINKYIYCTDLHITVTHLWSY